MALVLAGVFAVFIPALMLPGPDFVAVVRSALTNGKRAGLLTTLGVSLGLCMYATLSVVGLSAILLEYQWLSWVVRALGGSYLIYLGIGLIRTKRDANAAGTSSLAGRQHPFVFGFFVTLTNPKAIVLFSSVFATAISASTPVWLMALMIALVTVSSLIWYSLVSVFISTDAVVHRFRWAKHTIERVAGVCFIAVGGMVLADARHPIAS